MDEVTLIRLTAADLCAVADRMYARGMSRVILDEGARADFRQTAQIIRRFAMSLGPDETLEVRR